MSEKDQEKKHGGRGISVGSGKKNREKKRFKKGENKRKKDVNTGRRRKKMVAIFEEVGWNGHGDETRKFRVVEDGGSVNGKVFKNGDEKYEIGNGGGKIKIKDG